MPRLHEIIASIHRLDALVSKTELKLARQPENWNLAALLDTNSKLLARRKREFSKFVESIKGSPVSYSVYGGKAYSTPHVRSICSAFTSFETAVLLTAQSKLLNQPVKIRKLEQPIAASALNYGYMESKDSSHLAFVACTRGVEQMEMSFLDDLEPGDPKRLQCVPDKVLLESARDIFSVVKVADPRKLSDFARINGPAPLLEINKWCGFHTDEALDAEAQWGAGEDSLMHATSHQMETLNFMIHKLSDETSFEYMEVKGSFYSFNVRTRRFAFEADDLGPIAGKLPKEVFGIKKPVMMPRRYKLMIKRQTKENEALGQKVITNTIESFEEIK